jgi:hypothetical protein
VNPYLAFALGICCATVLQVVSMAWLLILIRAARPAPSEREQSDG